MTDGQYRAIVAYLNFWPKLYNHFNIVKAMEDIGITDKKEDVILELSKAGHQYDEETNTIRFRS